MSNEQEQVTVTDLDDKSSEDLQEMLDGLTKEVAEEAPAEAEKPVEEVPETESLKEKLAKLEKRLQDKEAFIAQRNQEIGLLRKQVRERLPEPDIDVTDEEMIASPKEALKKALKQHEQRKLEAQEKQTEETEQFKSQAREAISQWAPDFDERVPELVELMKADQAPESLLTQFRNDPVATLNPAVTFQLIKRLELAKRVKDLEAKLEQANKRPADMVSKIQQAGRAKPVATNTAPSPKSHNVLDNLTEADIDNMSAEDLVKLEKQLLRNK